jgi:hypothetical protein
MSTGKRSDPLFYGKQSYATLNDFLCLELRE